MAPRPARYYSVSEVVVVLLVAALTCVALDSQGLLDWTRRQTVGRFQTALLAVLTPSHRLLSRVGLTEPMARARLEADLLATRFAGPPPDALSPEVADALPDSAQSNAGILSPDAQVAVVEEPGEDARLIEAIPLDAGGTLVVAADEVDAGVPSGSLTLLLVGDSMMAAGLASAIARALQDEEDVRVVRAYKEATGLARPDVYDWMTVLPPVLARVRPNVVVCSLGGNDMQSIRLGDDVLEAGGSRWRTEYRQRVRKFMRLLTGTNREVLWLGLPVMRSTDFNNRVAKMNAIFAEEARSVPHVRYQDSSPAVAGEDGTYASFGPGVDGSLVQLRMDDGVHYTRAGGEVVAKLALAWLRHPQAADLTSALKLRPGSGP